MRSLLVSMESDRPVSMEHPFQQQVLMLLAKPGALKHACDISRDKPSFARRRPKACKCGRGEILAQKRLTVGQISAIYGSLILHRRSCPLWSSLEQTQNFGFVVSSQHLKVAIQLGMSINHEAGGVSIGPMLLLRGMKRPDSPAFLVMRDLRKTFDLLCLETCGEDIFLTILTESARKILQIFAEGKASPGEIDEYGNSLLHVRILRKVEILTDLKQLLPYALETAWKFRGHSPFLQRCATQFVEALLSSRVSANAIRDDE